MIGAIALISEISSITKNYYIQSIGVVFLMLGVFLINTNVKSKTKIDSDPYHEEEE
jgi:general stress protein CsbA